MKKTIYTLGSLLLVCIVGLVLLFAGRMGDQRELKTLQTRQSELILNLEAIEKEKSIWEGEKTRVAQGLVSVRQILNNTLIDLEEVTDFIGLDLILNSTQESELTESAPNPQPTLLPSTLQPGLEIKTSPLTNTDKPVETAKPIEKIENNISLPESSAAVSNTQKPSDSKPSDSPPQSQKEE